MGILSDFFGGSARKDIRRASQQANQELDTGFTDASGRYDEAYDLFSPYADQGARGSEAYTNALLGTPEQKQALFDAYSADPAMQGVLGQQSNALLRQMNASGSGTGGGKLALAGTRVGLENWNQYLNRLQGLGQQGLQATNNQSNIRVGQGDLRWNLAGTKAGNAINAGAAISQTRSTGLNNLLGITQTGAKIASMF